MEPVVVIPGPTHTEVTSEQALALAEQMNNRPNQLVEIVRNVFDLPDGYLLVNFGGGQTRSGGFTCGIAPDGKVSS